jgi:hypothetical protein
MPAVIHEILDVQMLGGQQCLSRYHFVDPDGVGTEEALINGYLSSCLPAVCALQTAATKHIALRHRQIYPAANLPAEVAISPTQSGGNNNPPSEDFLSISVKWALSQTVPLENAEPHHIKKGGKHLPGVSVNNENEPAVYDANFNALVQAWFATLLSPSGANWQLCVASFETAKSSSINTPTTRTITKAQTQAVATKYAIVLSCSGASISTQNTRKVLRGRTY